MIRAPGRGRWLTKSFRGLRRRSSEVTAVWRMHTSPAADRTTDLAKAPKSVGKRVTTRCRLTYILNARALDAARRPAEVTTDPAPAYPRALDELVPEAWHVVEQYANNPLQADHGRLKARTRPMRGLKRIRSRPSCL